ncbi:MAG: tRNA uridine-5-carboxymethylaminomethyl(34) synthesis GTPase MnmE [Alphaproteobacteria bacterium]|nr:tRNA uridine-5-carboxymethylaminomethyl(34) synthesis GTPase MnmE [Alphaproteobacteria bacterium]
MADTIFALATAQGRAGLAVVRISGPEADQALSALTGVVPLPARRLKVAEFRHPLTRELLDRGIIVWFGKPASYTGEDVAECHLHGGPAVVAGVLDALASLPDLRLAEPGEFTRRAFEHGKLDLTAAEAVADLVAAETSAQRQQALRQMSGQLGQTYDRWRERLTRLLAHVEASIDFSDEDLPADLTESVGHDLGALAGEIATHLQDARRGERLRNGLRVAIIGAPNAGKSTLLNTLAQRDAAIVTPIAGTTRDVIEVHLDLGGYPVVIADTAGIRRTSDEIEAEGVRRAMAWSKEADLRLILVDQSDWPRMSEDLAQLIGPDSRVLITKIDRTETKDLDMGARGELPPLKISALNGQGIGALLAWLTDRAARHLAPGEHPALTRQRHRVALRTCLEGLRRAETGLTTIGAGRASTDLVAEDLRMASRELGRITGRVDVEDLLDVIFRDFCIGK